MGTFFELAQIMQAGEDYSGWWDEPEWRPYRDLLLEAEALLCQPASGMSGGLWELAWKQLMACSYETAWHNIEGDGACRPASWARAVAAHARSVFVIAAAASWREQADRRPSVERVDIDHDGEQEIVIKNNRLFAVFSPAHGGRLIYLFDLQAAGGCLVVGNPADDWNWQEEANRYMDQPRNHPGACADVGHEHDRYEPLELHADDAGAEIKLINSAPTGGLAGAAKIVRLAADARYLEVEYRLPFTPERFSVEFALSPNYLDLLRQGRRGVRALRRGLARGWRNGECQVWVQLLADQPALWDIPNSPECGHGLLLRVTAYGPVMRLRLGVGGLPQVRQAIATEPASQFELVHI